ncbi:FKBP-type peptidyl-prolyl cis-trans isomerase N-terminal domain-containing protein, partial [Klebsiella pneumoniae]|nr:FKBP-type peptidyl-prolyl cis-trans isomerase N-terminal domain-containing protein [Klebsiella pneumoniae]
MNTIFKISALTLSAALALSACGKKEAASEPAAASAAQGDTSSIGSTMQQASYAMGVDIGRSLKQMKEQGAEIDLKVFTEAMQAVYDGKEIKMTEEQAQEVMMKFLQEQQAKAVEKHKADAKANKE